jgi:hypothetical protein
MRTMIGVGVPPIHTHIGPSTGGDWVAAVILSVLVTVVVAWTLIAWIRSRIDGESPSESKLHEPKELPRAA